ncbi:MAG TPA: glycosyltransferase N-terminal domain-containing protein [Chthoniobacterales bacterium]|jgi:3-deoxy-D-manno-octulosonic-acid transferase
MTRFLYNLLFPFALLAFLPGYIIKMLRRGNYRNKFGQRLGFYDRATRARLTENRRTWMHAVSVGEVMVALKLSAKMKKGDPRLHLALTTTTTTGFALASRRAPDWIEVLYTPLDFWPIMRRAFAVIRPLQIVLVEAEVWPNMTALAHARKIPLALVNARLSPRSEARFSKFRWLVTPCFRRLDLVCVQEEKDVTRWEWLGVPHDRIRVVGSIKFDPEEAESNPETPQTVLRTLGVDLHRPILLAGSTHQGEERILGRIFLALRHDFQNLFLIIAPRHIERLREVESDLRTLGLTVARRSQPTASALVDCLLLDTVGELRDWYLVATVVFVGKSLTARGGQNPVEAIVANRPVVFGPHMENFAALTEALIVSAGAVQLPNEPALQIALAELLRDPVERERLVAAARRVLDHHRGATERTAALLQNLAPSLP